MRPLVTPSTRILVVDDEPGVRDLMMRWLRSAGHDVVAAGGAAEALGLASQGPLAVAVCDLRMPERDGVWLLGQLRRYAPDTAVIVATGVQDVGAAVSSLRQGVIDYLMKPFGRDRLREAVQRGLDWHRAALASRLARERLEGEMARRRDHLAKAFGAVQVDSRGALETVLVMLTIGEPALLEHGRRVAVLAAAIARERALGSRDVELVERAALLHDLPKLTYPEAIARREGPLLAEEVAAVRTGPDLVAAFLRDVPFLADASEVAYARYERWDGSGYPRALLGEAIPLPSRILAVADTFDTLLQPRRYRAAMDPSAAMAEVTRCSGTQFDPGVVAAFASTRQDAIVASRR